MVAHVLVAHFLAWEFVPGVHEESTILAGGRVRVHVNFVPLVAKGIGRALPGKVVAAQGARGFSLAGIADN